MSKIGKPVSRLFCDDGGGEGVESEVLDGDEAVESVQGGGIICRPTPLIRRIKGLLANAPGARIYAKAYSPLPLCLNKLYA